MVSLRQTSLKYRGKKADTYDEIRTKQARWDFEDNVVGKWLGELRPNSVLDCPVGTGRFIKIYRAIKPEFVTGVDISERMITLARRKARGYPGELLLVQGDATAIETKAKWYDVSICVRFLDLIDEEAMRAVVTEMARVSRKNIICTIRLGDKYVPKSNTAEHDQVAFNRLISRLGWKCEDSARFREGSWHVLLLRRK